MKCLDPKGTRAPSNETVINFLAKAHNFYDFITNGIECLRG